MPSIVSAANDVYRPAELKSSMIWVSTVSSITELSTEADFIVRAKVIKDPEPRIETFTEPIWSEDGKITGKVENKLVFSDTQMQVLDVFKGEPVNLITVMQTGGAIQDLTNSSVRLSIEDDPLYIRGEESVLFLVNISGDSIHSHGRTLYRIINPASRYTINSFDVNNHYEFSSSTIYPKTIDELISQIQEALK